MKTSYCFFAKPQGGRDLWWCFILNEPCILTYMDNKPTCPHCQCQADSTGPNPGEYAFYGDHVFLANIGKPVRSIEYLGPDRGEH